MTDLLAFLPDSRLLIAHRGVVTVGDDAPLTLRGVALGISPDGTRLVTAEMGALFVWSVPDGRLVVELDDPEALATAACFTPDHLHTADGVDVKTWDLARGDLVSEHDHTIKPGYGDPTALLVTPAEDRALILYSGWDESMVIFYDRELDMSDMQWSHQEVRALAPLPDPALALVGGKRGFGLQLLNHVDFYTETEFEGAGEVECVASCPDGTRVVAGSGGEVLCWNVSEPTIAHREVHGADVTRVAIAASGRVASASADGSVRIWDPPWVP